MHQSFLNFRGRRYLWISLGLCIAACIAYAWHAPRFTPNGGTWLGYTLGGIGAALILWLTALGIRKRSYAGTLGTVQGWVSAHIYLGLSLIVIVTLHTGFQFGWNIHTVAYALMCTVVVSGIVGMLTYVRMPVELSANRASLTREQMLGDLADVDARSLRVAQGLPATFSDAIRANRDRTHPGGNAWSILSGRDHSQVLLPTPTGAAQLVANPGQARLLEWLGAELASSNEGERSRLLNDLLGLISARRVLLARLRRDAQIRGWLEAWLFVHVPVTFALLGALIAHVVSVFVYW